MAIKFDDTGEMVGSPGKGKVVFDDQQPKRSIPFGVGLQAAMETLPQIRAAKYLKNNPQTVLPMAGAAIGSMVAPGLGTAVGAGLGQIGSRMIDIKRGAPVQSPLREAVGPMVQTALGGLPEVSGVIPKWLGGNPGTTTIAQKAGQALDKAGQTLSGVKKGTLPQVYKEGFNIYKAPSLPKAQELFSQALGPEGQTAMKVGAKEAFDPALGQARTTAIDIGTKLEEGKPITAIEALKARQATDRIISSTPETDKMARDALYNWRGKFDDVMTNQSGPLKGASNLYRRAIVKDQILNPSRITKSGRPSAFLPLVLGAGGRSAEGIAHTLLGTSPATWGLGAATLGSVNPTIARSGLAGLIEKLMQQINK